MANRRSNRSATAAEERTRARWLIGDRKSARWRAGGGKVVAERGLGFEGGGAGEEEESEGRRQADRESAEEEEERREAERARKTPAIAR